MKPDKQYKGRSTIRMFNMDCGQYMNACKRDSYQLSIVDPPYGIDASRMTMGKGSGNDLKKHDTTKKWDMNVPSNDYFRPLFHISINQIIWGGNYFNLRPSRCWLLWDKMDYNSDFASHEMAWTSFDKVVKCFRRSRSKGGDNKNKIHPTQKPVQLYKWLLTNYANEGDTIFDSHGGSMSIAIACWDLGFDLDICELDTDYFNDAVKRFENHISQTQLF